MERETARRNIAYILVIGYLALLAAPVAVWMFSPLAVDDLLKIETALASIAGGLVGAVVGFYFREQSS